MTTKQIFSLLFLTLFSFNVFAKEAMQVFKSPTCGCCSKWISHLEDHGFETKAVNAKDMSVVKDFYGIPGVLQSCHTGVVNMSQAKYIFEGHIPAEIIQRFLDNPPKNSIGLSVPGMPLGSPGMEVGDRKDYYEVYVMFPHGVYELYEKVNDPSAS